MGNKLKFTDSNGDIIIMNYDSWLSIIKGLLIMYAHKTEIEAEEIVLDNKSGLLKAPYSYSSAALKSHELEYHWAMLAAYGEMYWLAENGGISSQEPESYSNWYDNYIEKNNLNEAFVFIKKVITTDCYNFS